MPKPPGRQSSPSAAALTKSGLDFAREGRLDQALSVFTWAIELDHSYWEAYRLRGIASARLGDRGSALKDLDLAIRHLPPCAGCFHERGMIRMMAGQAEEALADFARCLELDPGYAPAWSSRAGVLSRRGANRNALKDIETALSLDPRNHNYLHNRSVILTALERYAEAIEGYEQVITLNPKSGGSYNNLAWLLATAKDPSVRNCWKAISYAGKALEIGRNGAWLDTLAAAYAECGNFEQAVLSGTEAYELSRPPNENFRMRVNAYRAGKTYSQWKNAEEAGK